MVKKVLILIACAVWMFQPVKAQQKKKIVFFGNSLTAGMGVKPEQAFPAVVQEKIKAQNLPYQVVNAGLSGETTAGGVGRIGWVLKNHDIDIFVLELGANDGLRGLSTAQTAENLKEIIRKVRQEEAPVTIVLAGMQVPPNMGEDYSTAFKKVFPRIAREENVHLIPFLLEKVGGNKALNQDDGIHPNAEGHQLLAENVWDTLKPLLTH